MRLPVGTAATVCGIAAIVLVTSAAERGNDENRGLGRREASRLRVHFDSVVAELSARDVSDLRPTQKAARAELVRTLGKYRDAGLFPHNHDFPGKRVPYFRDEHGTLCAMAYLVATTGRTDIVDAIAKRRNNAYIRELATDGRLRAWLDSVGLTVAEAARIQPAYNGGLIMADRYPTRYAVPSLVLGVPALFTTVLNWRASPEKRADATLFVGALSGAAMAILGGAILADERDGSVQTLGIADLTVGSAAVVAALRRSLRRARTGAPPPPVAATESRFTIDVGSTRDADGISPAARVQIRF